MIKDGKSQIGTTPPEEEKEVEYKDGKRVIIEADTEFAHLESFKQNYERGLQGKNKSLSMGLKRLNSYFGIRKKVMYLVGGYTGLN